MSSGAAARRNYGHAAAKHHQEPSPAEEEDDDERTAEDMLQEIEKLDKEDVAATRRMAALAAETRDIGAKTAATLKDQGEQIERTGNMLTGIDESLKSLGGRLGSAFGWKKKKKKDKSKGAEGGGSSRPGTPSSSSAASTASSSAQVAGLAVKTARDRMQATTSARPGSGRAPGYRPGPKGAESEAAQAEIDQNLDMINDLVLEMKAQAADMGQELQRQNGALNKLDLQTTVNSEGVKSATKAVSGRNWVGGLKKVEGKMQAAAANYASGGLL